MKKIKYLFGIGLLSALFSTCFGAGVNNSMSVFHIVGDSNAFLISAYGQASSNTKEVKLANHFSSYFSGGTRDGGTALFSYNSFVSPLLSTTYYLKYDLSIADGRGFGLTGYYLNTDNLYNSFQLFNQMSSSGLGFYRINYGSGKDFYPLVFDSNYSYFTLNDSQVIFNGTSYGNFDFGTLNYCFYGINRDFSCIYTTDNGGYNFVHFNYNVSNEYGNFYTGYLVQPLNSLNGSYGFEGTKTLILSTDSQDRIIYNIIDVYSDNVDLLSAGNVIDKGYIDTQSLSFINRYFFGNSVVGNFSEIYEFSGTYYFRSNLVQKHTTSATVYSSYCREYIDLCLVKTGLTLESDLSVSNILGGNGNTSTYSGSVVLNNCVETQVCYDITGDNEEVIRVCTTKCIDTGSIVSGSFVGSDGTIYYVDSPVDFSISSDGLVYDTGYLDSDGILSIDYYSGLFNGDSSFKLGVCPYPASNLLSFATKIKLGNFYPFMPLNCFISAFQQGAKVHFFDDFGLFPDLDSQLINGNTNFHITLYRFFDFLLSIGLLFVLSALHRLLVK